MKLFRSGVTMGIMILTATIAGLLLMANNRRDSYERREVMANTIREHKERVLQNPADTDSLAQIIEHARGSYGFGRSRALGALGTLINRGAIDDDNVEVFQLLGDGLLDRSGFVRHTAGAKCSLMGEKARPMKAKLIAAIRQHPNEGVARFAVQSLRNIGDIDPEVIDVLRYATTANDSFAKNDAQEWLQELEGNNKQPKEP